MQAAVKNAIAERISTISVSSTMRVAAEAEKLRASGADVVDFGAGEPPRDRVSMERSLGSRALFPTEADVGAKLSVVYGPFAAVVAVVNGEPLDGRTFPTDPNAAKDVIGHVAVSSSAGATGQAELLAAIDVEEYRLIAEATRTPRRKSQHTRFDFALDIMFAGLGQALPGSRDS